MKEVEDYYADASMNGNQPEVPLAESYDDNAQDYSYSEAAAEGTLLQCYVRQWGRGLVVFLALVKITSVDAYMRIYCYCVNLRVCYTIKAFYITSKRLFHL